MPPEPIVHVTVRVLWGVAPVESGSCGLGALRYGHPRTMDAVGIEGLVFALMLYAKLGRRREM